MSGTMLCSCTTLASSRMLGTTFFTSSGGRGRQHGRGDDSSGRGGRGGTMYLVLMGEDKDDEDMERETRTLEKERNIRQ